jgi:hypothetical protein
MQSTNLHPIPLNPSLHIYFLEAHIHPFRVFNNFVCICYLYHINYKNAPLMLHYTGCPKKLNSFFYFPRCPECGEWCKLHRLLLDTPSFGWNTRRSRGHKSFKMAPTKQQNFWKRYNLFRTSCITLVIHVAACNCGVDRNAAETKVIRISRQPSKLQFMIDRKTTADWRISNIWVTS